jgi:hypothetical protein
VQDALDDGRRFRILNVDETTSHGNAWQACSIPRYLVCGEGMAHTERSRPVSGPVMPPNLAVHL